MRDQAAAFNSSCRIYRAIGRPRFIPFSTNPAAPRQHYPGRFAGSLADLKELPQEYIDAKPGVALLSTH